MSRYHILVPDQVDPAAIELLQTYPEFDITAPGKMSREETFAAIASAHGLIVRSSTRPDAELLAAAPQLKVIARAGVGVDNIDLDAASAQGIVVMNTPGGNTIATAEHAFGLMLSLMRQIPQAHASLQAGKWERKAFQGNELRGKTLGILGVGRIGSAIAKRALAFEMKVIGHDPYVPEGQQPEGVRLVDFDTLLAESDILTLHAAASDATQEIINTETLAKMKTGARLINAARGSLIDAAALASALESGHIAGAALDVYTNEPPPEDHPLIGLANVVHTPHIAASTDEAQVAVAMDAAQQVADGLLHQKYVNVVNKQVLAG